VESRPGGGVAWVKSVEGVPRGIFFQDARTAPSAVGVPNDGCPDGRIRKQTTADPQNPRSAAERMTE